MNKTVDFQTAMELRDAGFPQRHPITGCFFEDKDGRMHAPTALEIIEQMPGATIGKLSTGEWACCFPLANNYTDYRQDKCPHVAAALAFIAWKKGEKLKSRPSKKYKPLCNGTPLYRRTSKILRN